MKMSHMLLAVVVAGASFAARAESTAPAATSYGDPGPAAEMGAAGEAPWKGTLSRAEVKAEFLQARASGTLPSGEAWDDPVAMKMAAARPLAIKLPAMAARRVMGAATDEPVTGDNYRFVGGEAGYAPADAAEYR